MIFGKQSAECIVDAHELSLRDLGYSYAALVAHTALQVLDSEHRVASERQYRDALRDMIDGVRAEPISPPESWSHLFDALSTADRGASRRVVTPFDLVTAATATFPDVLSPYMTVLRQTPQTLIGVLLAAGCRNAADIPILAAHDDAERRYAVVITYPDGIDESNRYATFPDAFRAFRSLRSRAFAEPAPTSASDGSYVVSVAFRDLREAIAITIREL